MLKKTTFAVILVATCLSLVSGAQAGSKSFGPGGRPISGMDLGSGR